MKKHFLKLLNFTFILTALLIVFTFGISAATVVEDMPAGDDLYFRIVEENGGQTMEFYGEGTALKAVHSETSEYLTPGYTKYIAASTNNYKNSSHYQYRATVTKVRFLTPNLTSFFDYFFYNFSKIVEVELHANITKLTDGAFNGIKAITTVYTTGQTRVEGTANLSNITTLGSYTFCDNKFSKIIFSSSTTYVGNQTFKGCTNLTSLELPAAIASTHADAFKGCAGVTTLTVYNNSIDVSKFAGGLTGLTTIVANSGSAAETYANANGKTFEIVKHPAGEGVFFRVIPENGSYTMEISGDGTALQALDSTGTVLKGGYSYTSNASKGTHYSYRSMVTKVKFLTPNLTSISGYYFYNFRSIAEVEFHPDMKNISAEAFLGITAIKTCYTTGQQVEVGTANLTNFTTLSNYAFSGNLFEKIVFGSDITFIGYQVFQNCKSLKSIELPANIAGVNAEAFAGCAAVTTLTVYNDSLDISGFAAKLTGLIKIIGYSGSPAQEFADGNDAIEFEIFSFPAGADLYFRLISENDSYTMEIFGEGTTLQAIDASTGEYMAGGYSYTNVAKNATHRPYKDMVTKVKFLTPNLTKINGYYFYDFRKIAEVEFHPDMKNVSTEAFLGITAIKTCYTTGQTPVEGTANLTNFNILESFAFSGNLFEKIVFGSDITTIGYQVFQNCKSLKSIELPANIAGVNAEAFTGCVSVTSLTVYNDKLGVANFAAKLTALETIAAHFGSPAYDYAYETGKNFVLVSANNLLTFEGFQIREENYNGLRSLFSANLVNLNELVEKGFTIVEMGSLIASSDKLEANGEELTVSYEGGIVSSLSYAAKIAVVKNGELTDARTLNSSTSEKLNYACTVINYDQNTYDKFATFRGYIVLEDSNGNSYVYYVDLVDTDGTNYNSTSLDKMVEKFENDGITDLTNNICYVDVKKFRENSMK